MNKLEPSRLFARPLLISGLCLALACAALFFIKTQAADTAKVIPVEEWTWIPKWSPDGRFVAVNWPAPALVGADGKLSRVIGKPIKQVEATRWVNPPTLSSLAGTPVGITDNLEAKRTFILKSPSYELMPVTLPEFHKISWSPNSEMIVGNGGIFSIPSGKLLLAFNSEWESAWSPDSRLLANSHTTGIDVWNVARKERVFSFPNLRAGMHSTLAWSPDGTKVAASVARSNLIRWKTLLRICSADGAELLSLYDQQGINGIGWSKDKNLFAYGDNALHILDGTTLKEVKVLSPVGANEVEFAWSPNGRLLAYKGEGEDTSLHVLDVSQMHELYAIPAEKTGRYIFKWSPDGNSILIQDFGQLAVCRALDGSYLGAKSFDDASSVDWTPDGKALAIGNFTTDSVYFEAVNLRPGEATFNKGTSGNPWQNQKVLRNLDDCFDELQKMLSADYIKELKSTREDALCVYQGGPGLGMTLRNTWGLRNRNPLTAYFEKMGITDGAHMSSIIIESFWHHLNGRSLNLEAQVKAYREVENRRAYIVAENRQLPDALLNCECASMNGKSITIGKLPAPIKVVAFIQEKGEFSLSQLKALDFVRTRYPQKQVAISVLKFSARSIPESAFGWRGGSDRSNEINDLEQKNKSSIYLGTGTRAIFDTLVEFAGGVLGDSGGALPQTLIISDKNIVTTRINGSVSAEDTFPIEDAIDELLKPGGK